MKRSVVIFALTALLLTLCACGAATEEQTPASPPVSAEPSAEPSAAAAPEPTAVPEPTATPEPETVPAVVRGGGLGAVYALLREGDALTVTGEEGDFYLADAEGLTLLVEKRLVALAGAKAFETWTGYAVGNTPVYDNLYFDGGALRALAVNVPVKVLTELGACLKVELEDGSVGFAPADMISKTRIRYSSSNKSGGPVDGGDIPLAGQPGSSSTPQLVLLADGDISYPAAGTVLADGVEAYLCILSRGDEVRVLERTEDTATLLLSGQRATVPAALLRFEGEAAFSAWEGYAQSGAKTYDHFRLPGKGESLPMNTPVQVLEDFGAFYWVQWETGAGFAPASAIGTAPIRPSAGGGSGPAWTDPVL